MSKTVRLREEEYGVQNVCVIFLQNMSRSDKYVASYAWVTLETCGGYSLFLSVFNQNYKVFSKNHVSNFMKIRSAVIELLHADRQTDRLANFILKITAFRRMDLTSSSDKKWGDTPILLDPTE
jgi:hypothetical protein